MIRNLNPAFFDRFGTILNDKDRMSGIPNCHSVFLSEGTVTDYRTAAPAWLGGESGQAILSVSEDGREFADFYLDKPVQLKRDIRFRLTGLGGRASVQMGGITMPVLINQRVNDRDFAVRPQVRVESLYTLFYQEKEPGFFFSGEAHPMAELLYVDDGRVHSVADGQELLLERGDLVLYSPEQWHMQYADEEEACKIVTIGFWARGIQWESLSDRRFRLGREAMQLLQRMLEAQTQNDTDRIFSLLTLLVLELRDMAAGAETDGQAVSGENTIIRKAQQYVQAHVMEKLTVPVVAAGVGVSASYLTALFHKHLAVSPGEYIRRIKLQQSKLMIREGRMNFTEISENLQYSTVHHFSRQFKQMFGITPTEYARGVR